MAPQRVIGTVKVSISLLQEEGNGHSCGMFIDVVYHRVSNSIAQPCDFYCTGQTNVKMANVKI